MEHQYLDRLVETIYRRISSDMNDWSAKSSLQRYVNAYFRLSQDKYYFSISRNYEHFLSDNFFHEFNKQYKLRKDLDFLRKLEEDKHYIKKCIEENDLVDLYFSKFKSAKVKHGETKINMELGSFFAKLLHTFRPDAYCALDLLVKGYLGLQNESYFISTLAVSQAYLKWAKLNPKQMKALRDSFEEGYARRKILSNAVSELKILDSIFWIKAKSLTPKRKRK